MDKLSIISNQIEQTLKDIDLIKVNIDSEEKRIAELNSNSVSVDSIFEHLKSQNKELPELDSEIGKLDEEIKPLNRLTH